MPVSGWKYLKWGSCGDCGDAQGRLHMPVLEGEFYNDGGTKQRIRGPHLPHFRPVCLSCTDKYSLDILCDKHRLPLKFTDQRCQLCVE